MVQQNTKKTEVGKNQDKGSTSAEEQTSPERTLEYREITVGKQTVRVGIWPGDKTQMPLLMFNGIGVKMELLKPFVEALGTTEAIVFDIPGAGESPTPKMPFRLWQVARLAAKVLDKLGYDKVNVLGLSWGGTLAQQFALMHPLRCQKLVLAATAPGPLMLMRPSVVSKMMTPRRFNDPEYRKEVFPTIYGGAARDNPEVFEEVSKLVGRVCKRGYLWQQLAVVGWVSIPWLPLLRQKTLVIAGDDDPIIPMINKKILAGLIPRAELKVVEDGHLFIVSSAPEIADMVDDFLYEKDGK